ncbi:MAG: DciA family protein [Methylovulum sp.]|nr:DciA family protein [Methylovulum sp.]
MLGYYASQIEQQGQLLQQVRKSLPENLAKHACHCLISNNTLLLYTDSAVWATQLRFYTQAILGNIAPVSKESVQKVQIKILTEITGINFRPMRKANIPSTATIEIMRKQSQSVSDANLKQALQRLNSTLTRLADQD